MKTYTCYSIKQFQFLVSDGSTPIEVIKNERTGRYGFVFLLTDKLLAGLQKYNAKDTSSEYDFF